MIVWLSLTPSPPDSGLEGGDKLGHFAGYALLMAWFSFLYASGAARLAYGLGFVALGIALEFAQGASGYRTYEPADMLANALGVILGWAAAVAASRIRRR